MSKYQDIEKIKQSMCYPQTPFEENNQWHFNIDANCYQFAIMTMFQVPISERLLPGEISGYEFEDIKNHRYTDIELVKLVKADLSVLECVMEECKLGTPLEEGQWKIAVLNCDFSNPKGEYDFHFLRQTMVTPKGYWFQKFANQQHPDMCDVNEQLITNPATAEYDYHYHLVDYFVVQKMNKKRG